MTKVGVIGLGDMGSGLAKNLLKAGFDVAGLDLSEERRAAFVKMGGRAVETPAALADGAEAVFIMVMNGGQVEAVLFGADGALIRGSGQPRDLSPAQLHHLLADTITA